MISNGTGPVALDLLIIASDRQAAAQPRADLPEAQVRGPGAGLIGSSTSGAVSLGSSVNETIEIEPVRGWKGRAQHGQRMTLTSYEITAGAPDVHEHQHPQEEAWIVIEGQLALWVDGEERLLGPGDSAIVGAGVRHWVRALQPSRALVVDSPARRRLPGTSH